jgi:phage terminase small subunit
MAKLTRKQKRFVEEYLVDLNATQAAIRAGYKESSARQTAAENLSKPNIQAAIDAAMGKRSQRTEVTQDMIVQQLAKIAFADIRDTVEWDEAGIRMKPSNQIDGTIVAGVSQTEIKGIISKEVKMNDRMRALEMLGRHLGMFNDKFRMDMNAQVVFVNEPPDDD